MNFLNSIVTTESFAATTSKLNDKVIVITGASSGFGKGAALKMAAQGAHVVLAARRLDLLQQLATKCGHGAIAVQTDVSRIEDLEHLQAISVKQFGHIDVWINDVGVGAIGPFEQIPLEDESRLIDVNLKGVIYGSQIALKQFKTQGYGTIINLGSVESVVPLAYHAVYAASKAGVLNFDRALVQELRLSKSKNIKISTIMPWAVDTPWWDHAANYSGGTARMGMMDPPDKVVNAIVANAIKPRREVLVGWKAKAASVSHQLMPEFTEKVSAKEVHKYQIVEAPKAPPKDGALIKPMATGTEIYGGVRERMKHEKEAEKSVSAEKSVPENK